MTDRTFSWLYHIRALRNIDAALKLGDLNLAIEEKCLSSNQDIKLEGHVSNFLINHSGDGFM